MEFKKMTKRANTLTGIVIGLLLVIGVFTVAFGFWNRTNGK